MRKGRKSAAQTPAPPQEQKYGSSRNPAGSASSKSSAEKIKLSESILETLKNKVSTYNKRHKKNVGLPALKAVMRRGMGAYSKSHRPTITGGAPNSRQAWGFARVNKFLDKKAGKPVKKAYVQDDDLLEKGGLLNVFNVEMSNLIKNGIVLTDKSKNIIVIAYDNRNQERDNSLYNKALIYYSVKPLRQANEIIENFDNEEYSVFDVKKIEEYKNAPHLIILNQNEVVYDTNNPDIRYDDGGEISDFTSYQDAMSYLDIRAKDFKNKNEFLQSEEYKKIYPKIVQLYKTEKSDYAKFAKKAMDEADVKFGDRVFYDFVSPFSVEKYSGIIINREGAPFVKLDEGQKTMSGQSSVKWHKGWRKEKINNYEHGGNVKGEIALPDTYATYDKLKPILENQGYILNKKEMELPVGKLAKGMNLSQVAAHHGLSTEKLIPAINDGIKTELEHTDDPAIARAIALDHLYEDPEYYTKLKSIEKPVTKERVSKAIMSVLESPNKSVQRAALWKRLQDKRASMADGGELIDNLNDYLKDNVYKDPKKSSRWRVKGSNYTFSSKKEAEMVAERRYQRELYARQNPTNKSQMAEGGHVMDADGELSNDGKKGGYFKGRSHASGGIKAFNVDTNTPIEVEGDEVIITKAAVKDPTKRMFEGRMMTNREILSKINQSGGGVAFGDGGETDSCGCDEYAYGGETINDINLLSCKEIDDLMQGIFALSVQSPDLHESILKISVYLKNQKLKQNC